MSSELLRVSRPILRPDHQRLRANIPRINHLGELSIKWRRLGETGITLIERGQYEQVAERPSCRLKEIGVTSVAAVINEVLTSIAGAKERLVAPPRDVKFMGNGPYLSIAYILDTEQPVSERTRLADYLDELSNTKGVWSEFEPHVSVATIPAANAEEHILDEFWDIAPRDLTFLGAQVTVV